MADITTRFHIDAKDFGSLVGFYYLGYAGMQLPIGMLLDKFGVRYVVAACALVCALGNAVFVLSESWPVAMLGRFLVGFGSAAGALGAIKAVRMIFSHENVSKMIGLTITIGLIGAICGKQINIYLRDHFGYDDSLIGLSLFGVGIASMIFFVTRDCSNNDEYDSNFSVKAALLEVLKMPRIYIIAILGAFLVGPLEAFADIWGDQFFTKIYGFDKHQAAELSGMAVYMGMCVGSIVLAWFVDKYQIHYEMIIVCGAVMAAIFYFLLNKQISGYNLTFVLMFMVGVMCAYQVIIFSLITDIVPARESGIAISFVNMINMVAGHAFHWGIGSLFNYHWDGKYLNDMKIYPVIAYSDALYLIPITLVIGTVGFYIARPKRKA